MAKAGGIFACFVDAELTPQQVSITLSCTQIVNIYHMMQNFDEDNIDKSISQYSITIPYS